jgi:hypothetical protein
MGPGIPAMTPPAQDPHEVWRSHRERAISTNERHERLNGFCRIPAMVVTSATIEFFVIGGVLVSVAICTFIVILRLHDNVRKRKQVHGFPVENKDERRQPPEL